MLFISAWISSWHLKFSKLNWSHLHSSPLRTHPSLLHTDFYKIKSKFHFVTRASLVAQRLKRLPGMWETGVWSRGREDPLEKELATHSSTLAWRIPWREEPGRLQSMGLQRVRHDWGTSLSLSFSQSLRHETLENFFFISIFPLLLVFSSQLLSWFILCEVDL